MRQKERGFVTGFKVWCCLKLSSRRRDCSFVRRSFFRGGPPDPLLLSSSSSSISSWSAPCPDGNWFMSKSLTAPIENPIKFNKFQTRQRLGFIGLGWTWISTTQIRGKIKETKKETHARHILVEIMCFLIDKIINYHMLRESIKWRRR